MKLNGKQAFALADLVDDQGPDLAEVQVWDHPQGKIEVVTAARTAGGHARAAHLIGPRGGTKKVRLIRAARR